MRVVILVSALMIVKSLNAFTGGVLGWSGIGMIIVTFLWAVVFDLVDAYEK